MTVSAVMIEKTLKQNPISAHITHTYVILILCVLITYLFSIFFFFFILKMLCGF